MYLNDTAEVSSPLKGSASDLRRLMLGEKCGEIHQWLVWMFCSKIQKVVQTYYTATSQE